MLWGFAMDLNELYDIYDVWHIPWWQTTFFWWMIYAISAVILVIMLVIFLQLLFTKRKPEEPWRVACRQLAFAHKKAQEKVMGEELFYAEITRVLKWYLTIRFEDDSEARTDIELLSYAQQNPAFPKLLVLDFSQLLERASQARFAKMPLPIDQLHEDYTCAVQVIEQTIAMQEK